MVSVLWLALFIGLQISWSGVLHILEPNPVQPTHCGEASKNPVNRKISQIPFLVSLSNHVLGGNQPKATAWFSVEKRGSTGSPRTDMWELDSLKQGTRLPAGSHVIADAAVTC
jgi:hypothetical protein